MERDDFLKALRRTARETKARFPKDGREWIDAISTGRSHADGRRILTNDAIYELMCCFAVAAALKGQVQNLQVIQADGEKGFRFPLKPGAKSGFAFFRFEFGGVSYDLCCGTEIDLGNGEPPEAPDISLQRHSQLRQETDRQCGQPIALWDAKYHDGTASKTDVQQMNWWCDIFNLPPCRAGDVLSQILPATFQVSAVITNAPLLRVNRRQLLKRRFSIVCDFSGSRVGRSPAPSRAEHEQYP